MIEITQLSKSFGSVEVLNSINLKLSKGRIYGIVGANGSGKTTLFKCIAGLEEYNGHITSELEPLKNHLGLLFTEPYFLSKLTGREYVILMCNARDKSFEDLDKQNIFDLPLDRYASQYSTGMKKKLALLAVLLQENEFFMLDEPFNGVDVQSNLLISEILNKLRELGKTILLSSHVFSSLTELCDEILVLKNGQIKEMILKNEFHLLETNMKAESITNRIERLKLK